MSKPLAVLVPLVLALAACTSPNSTNDTQPDTTSGISPTTVTLAPDGGESSTTTDGSSQPPTTSDRPLAPDFTMELGDGGTYTLSDGAKPVYLVFWAEW